MFTSLCPTQPLFPNPSKSILIFTEHLVRACTLLEIGDTAVGTHEAVLYGIVPC